MPALPLDEGAERPPWPVLAAGGLALVEAVGVVAYAIAFVIGVLPLRDPWLTHAGFALGVVVFLLAAAAALAAAGVALARLRHWPRSLLVVAQLMFVAVGVPIGQGGDWFGWAIVVVAGLGVLVLLHPAITAAIEE